MWISGRSGDALRRREAEAARGVPQDSGRRQGFSGADVQRVAKQYFSPSNRTVGTLVRPPKATAAGTEDGGTR